MKKVLFSATATLLLSTLISCNKESNPNCGANNDFYMYLFGPPIVDSSTGFYYSYIDPVSVDRVRVFQWSELVSDVCPEEHVKVHFRVDLNVPADSAEVSTRARVSYGVLSERTFAMDFEGIYYEGNGEVGLKQAYGTDPAEFIPVVEVFFPSKGSYSADTAFLKQKVIAVEILAKYLNYQY